jgi:autotransporter-associated beta strand protein
MKIVPAKITSLAAYLKTLTDEGFMPAPTTTPIAQKITREISADVKTMALPHNRPTINPLWTLKLNSTKICFMRHHKVVRQIEAKSAQLFCIGVAFYLIVSMPTLAAPPPGYYLVWSDEFNGTSLDTTHWEYARNGWRNSAYDTSAAVRVANGDLIITTYTQGGTNFTGFIDTDNTANEILTSYGYYEASIQFSNAPGQWSAFWLQSPSMMNVQPDGTLGNTNNNPTNGVETDIFEHIDVTSSGTPYNNGGDSALWWNGYGPQEHGGEVYSSGNLGVGTGFHTYGLLWTTNSYTFYVDGNVKGSSTSGDMISSAEEFIRLTSEVESNSWAGTVPPGGYPSLANSQVQMLVDYVRYYVPTNVIFWTGASSAYWNNSANWISNMLPVATSDLGFSYFGRNNRTMTLGQDYSVDGLIFQSANGAFTINAGNTLTLGAGGIKMIAANYNVTLNNAVNVVSNQTWTIWPSLTDNGNLSGSATLTKAGYGTLVLNGANSFSGTLNVDTGSSSNNDGIVEITSSTAIANVASPIYIRNTGSGVSTLQLSAVTLPQAVSLAGRNANVAAIESLSGNNSLAGGLTLTTGGNNYLIQDDAGALTIGGTISAGSTATGARTLTLQGNGSFAISASIQNGYASALNLVKSNTLTLTLSGTNTYTGGTTNSRGTLFVNGSLAGPLAVNGGTLAGTGAVGGNTTIQSGCELSPGSAIANAIGTLSFGNNLTLASGSITYLEISAAPQTNDQLNVGGTLTCGGTLNVANLAGTLAAGQSFKLFNAGTVAGNFSTLTLPLLNAGLAWNTNNLTNGIISVIAVSPAETLAVTNPGDGQMQLAWDYGTLQSATNVDGPYDDITDATSPYTLSMTNTQQFYRIKED